MSASSCLSAGFFAELGRRGIALSIGADDHGAYLAYQSDEGIPPSIVNDLQENAPALFPLLRVLAPDGERLVVAVSDQRTPSPSFVLAEAVERDAKLEDGYCS